MVLAGLGAAVAILLSSDGASSSTTVLVESGTTVTETDAEPGAASDAVEAGRYVQAGSFKTVEHAEDERERLAADGVEVDVVSSDGAEEFYPGFQVLLGGPFETGSAEAAMLKALHRNGVPSAFARDLNPALEVGEPGELGGSWTGVLDRTSGERPKLTGPLPVTMELDPDGSGGTITFEDSGCADELTLAVAGPTTFSYTQTGLCVGGEELLIRPSAGQLMVSVLPTETDVLVMGSLSRS